MSTSLLFAITTTAGVAAGVFLDASLARPAQWCVALFVLASFLCAAKGHLGFARLGIAGAF
ncbi:MAG: hypothetical protein FJW22_11855, partial [Acidimicrobiia bacterium]|nr:hypothetical protein [Acidimicrobiia bacterium]